MIGENIRITVVEIRPGKVRLGVQAPRDVPVHRLEVAEAIAKYHFSFDPKTVVTQ